MSSTSYLCTRRLRRHRAYLFLVIALVAPIFGAVSGCGTKKEAAAVKSAPALTVQVASATTTDWPETLQVSGPIVPWQEAIIGSEISGQRLTELRVNVGDRVKKGEVLARYNTDTLQAEHAELQAMWRQAEADRQRALALQDKGALSRQQIENYINQADVAKARLDAKSLQLRYATVVAPEDGIISARSATLGAIGGAGAELFRLILNSRLEWRGELSPEQLPRVQPGQSVVLTLPDSSSVQATIRQLSPSLNAQSRMAIAYADIVPNSRAHAGMYASGTIAMQTRTALVVPAVSVVIRDGRAYVFTVDTSAASSTTAAPKNTKPEQRNTADAAKESQDAVHKVTQQLVTTGLHQGSNVEIASGLKAGTRVVLQGAGFLNDGDSVHIVSEPSKQP